LNRPHAASLKFAPLPGERDCAWRVQSRASLAPPLVAATEEEPGTLQFEFNIGDDQKTVDIFERYADSKAALFHQTASFAPNATEFFAVAKLTRWVIYGTPSDEFRRRTRTSSRFI
jgi:quinol monooxygenase YgiN